MTAEYLCYRKSSESYYKFSWIAGFGKRRYEKGLGAWRTSDTHKPEFT